MKQKNEILTNKNGLALFVKGFGKRAKKIGLFVEYTQWHEDFVLSIYNTWCEIIHVKSILN